MSKPLRGRVAIVACAWAGWLTVLGEGSRDERFWPQWRGPLMTGAAPGANPPVEWSEKKNIRWKTPLPGLGHSTPIVYSNHVFLTTALPVGDPLTTPIADEVPGSHDNRLTTHRHQYAVIAVDRRDGKIRWHSLMREALPHEGGHNSGSLASHSPVTDGERVYAFFGSQGLYCLDFTGQVIWSKQLGTMQTKHGHGEGSSPMLQGNTLVVNWDHEGQSFVAAFEKRTGRQRWRVERQERTSWASPIAIEQAGRFQVIVSGTGRVRGYDLESGEVIWACGGLSANVVASPVAGSGIVIAGSSYEKQAMFAVRLEGASGDITGTEQVLWQRRRSTPYVPSPLLYGDHVYFLRHYQNVLSRVHLETGRDEGGPFRLEPLRNIYASPVAAAGRIYVTSREGYTIVLSLGVEPNMLGLNRLADSFSASAALAGNDLFLRGHRHLYCLAERKSEENVPVDQQR